MDAAATAAEAVGTMEDQEYQLVLSDLQMESPEAGLKVLAHAQLMDYKPATALITSYHNTSDRQPNSRMLVEPQDVANVIAFLCSPDAAMIRGQVIFIDGGWSVDVGRQWVE